VEREGFFFFIFKHSWAPKRSWKISYEGPGKSFKRAGFFVSKRVRILVVLVEVLVVAVAMVLVVVVVIPATAQMMYCSVLNDTALTQIALLHDGDELTHVHGYL